MKVVTNPEFLLELFRRLNFLLKTESIDVDNLS